ncbi:MULTISPECIES: hypothetical protein [unclassified Rhizobium]|uniref:hypothetical protein n=1 Tax=unclassified Rhizobium TaxID=2613769 RepID=UPI001A99FC31|nr:MULTISPECIES: hypothetical protein [unclassified Rhizobium]MBX5157498.1 hypothetical protein [Rhizobium sp. NZLR8]MBX5163234.1 hypothetical protein [Rhizobium sp. NZLR4b]MBX5183849.1 hypothetical protein [Rhizobium sp. NZLR5]MBX5188725.1 hypothetical protein [Rhizobium sp. NZLR3b]MBX5195644.1 hypothetical protein [Rhizobium sp. NZLR10]
MLTSFESAYKRLPDRKPTGRYQRKSVLRRNSIKEVASFIGKDKGQQIAADR